MSEKLLFWGIDGCPAGWLCVGLGVGGEDDYFVGNDIFEVDEHLRQRGAKIALIDIPIGFSDDSDERLCDKEARKYIGARRSSVFRVPCRQAMEAYKKEEGELAIKAGKIASVEVTGGCLSVQTWGIAPKIAEMDCFLNCEDNQTKEKRRALFREVHPEVCFRALKGSELQYPKKKLTGLNERRSILKKCYPESVRVYKHTYKETKAYRREAAKDDIVDALAAAVTAKIGFGTNGSELKTLQTLPSNPPKDSCGLPMEMLYVESNRWGKIN